MPHQSWESLDPFLNTDEFASTATVRPVVGDPFTVRGIFDDPYLHSQLGEYELDTSRPRPASGRTSPRSPAVPPWSWTAALMTC